MANKATATNVANTRLRIVFLLERLSVVARRVDDGNDVPGQVGAAIIGGARRSSRFFVD
jgi:hypothetical protein